ncbi:ATP-binding protein [Endozoicomonas sp. YOMI1]|uniref:ATP-binding protein n=1 Tax=Endozoicomonas sp. YOMI1 TaxID=2828739 RepID=UPI0021492047|nr:ATP-binding protein [Endozoicomonas sp. YOMI1]
MTDEKGQAVRLEIDSELANTTLIAMAVRGLCAMTTLSPVEVNRVELCVVEIVNNAIEHAYGNEKGHKVEVGVSLLQACIMLTISDWGKPMDQGKLGSRDMSVDPDNPAAWLCSGRGLPIVQSLMDNVEYQTVGDKNSFIMSKQIRS